MPLLRPILTLFIITTVVFGFSVSAEEPTAKSTKSQSNTKTLAFAEDSAWAPSHFGGDGPIEMKDGVLSLGFGDPLTGVRWEGDLPKQDYEISLEARRVGGFDFFCGLTLPLADQRFSLVLGGWGGSLVGLSSIDGLDASNNETMLIRNFEKNRWYKVRVRVTKEKIGVWLDVEQIIDIECKGRVFDVRSEMLECLPLGIAAFQCESEVRNVQIVSIKAASDAVVAPAPAPQAAPGSAPESTSESTPSAKP